MKSMKKLIIASALSMMAASCYASVVPNTEQQKSVNVSFAAPEHLTVSLDQMPGLMAGKNDNDMDIAKLTVDSTSIKEFGVRGISGSQMNNASSTWKITGKNGGNPIVVSFSSNDIAKSHVPLMWNGREWTTFDTNVPVDIVVIAGQDISPDTYPLTVDVVGYQP
ncbi:TPA: pilus assembly protein [Salmonella enterica subsp. enterica serovar Chester]|uniref:Pilus assembly protein n=2 Tax=Salmonella enterica TaxID=28901 RepID=A0A5I0RAB3_SALET|nr:pilus assembly protein [Salmonella enterica]ECC3508172.1 pilus assembly protein [Salmonella enterica subsp. enterica]EDT5994250.1 pilus assembly protein [Salmonella enterica subsp. enterica serovar Sandiego]EGZ4506661.1 pilus assembly protein [Salmonella enterica subsp. enterica serovar Javiana]EAA1855667.1 pilus assembly protein [Salmonella enterica subsp. enterica serovar Chester]EAA5648258.1 pilus assembly protein [Salmonella enterica subsp. enterica serovar Chester]